MSALFPIKGFMSTFKNNLISQIEQNIIKTKEGLFVQAGSHQFQSFWTRDFCFASFGLSRVGRYEVVKNHLQKLLNTMNDDGLIPRILESSFSKKTVLLNTVFSFLPASVKKSKHNKKLKAEHFGEHGTLSIDSNALVIIACFEYFKYSNDLAFIQENSEKLILCFNFYKTRIQDGLITQGEFEDWQDSARRSGRTFYTNLLYHEAARRLTENSFIEFDLSSLSHKIKKIFYRHGLYCSLEIGEQVDLASNHLAILFDFIPKQEQAAHFHKMSSKEYNSGVFPLCAFPNSKPDQISWTCKYVGLSRYHDEMIWSWITGLKLGVLAKLEDTKAHSDYLQELEKLNSQFENIFEIYSSKTHAPVKKICYKSESPFSWGIGIILWSLD